MKNLVTNEVGSTDIYILASPNEVYMFEKSKAVEFWHELKQKHDDCHMLFTDNSIQFLCNSILQCLHLWFLLHDRCHPSIEIEVTEL